MIVVKRLLSGLGNKRARAEVPQTSGLPADLIELIHHESLRFTVKPEDQPVAPAGTDCAPVSCKGCFFALDCPSIPT